MTAIEYIPREAVLARQRRIEMDVVQVCDIEEIPAADVVRATGLTEDGRELVKIWPEAVNELADRLLKKMDEAVLGRQGIIGRSIIADMTEATHGPA